jgi:putative acetyltransferase
MKSDAGHQIRRAAPADAPAIADVLHAAFTKYKALYTEKGFAATVLDSEEVKHRMREGPVWVGLQNGVVVATVAAVVKVESVYIRGMAAVPAARGSGFGSALLHCVEDWAASQGYVRLFLSTTPFLDSAIRLYEKCGFCRMNEEPHDLHGTPLFTMEKKLPARIRD